jgi:hypothetical protein
LTWLIIEVFVFYCNIIGSAIFLGVKSVFKTNLNRNFIAIKKKYDAVEYYKNDLKWFSHMFIFLGLNLFSLFEFYFIYKPEERLK